MHPTMSALLELHDINQQRQLLRRQREDRETVVGEAEATLAKAQQLAEAAAEEANKADALQRQYQGDIEHADQRIAELREKQMSAKTNREYLSVINGIEESKNIKKMRSEQLKTLDGKIDELKQKAASIAAQRDAIATKVAETRIQAEADPEADISEAELDRLYNEKRPEVDAKFLECYERLVASRHRMPLMPIDMRTRSTPFGNLISLNHLEQIRKGLLVLDHASAAILYIKDENEPHPA